MMTSVTFIILLTVLPSRSAKTDGQVILNTCTDLGSIQVAVPTVLSTFSRPITFGLQVAPLNCTHKEQLELVTTEIHKSKDSTGGPLFLKDGYFLIRNLYYKVQDYCIQSITEKGMTLELCQHSCGNDLDTICVPKCCELDKVIDGFSRGSCHFTDLRWNPILYGSKLLLTSSTRKMHNGKLLQIPENTPVRIENSSWFDYKFAISPLTCSAQEVEVWSLKTLPQFGFKAIQFRFLSNGSLIYFNNSKWSVLDRNFCIDGLQNYGMNVFYTGSLWDQVVRVCPNTPLTKYSGEVINRPSTSIHIGIPIAYGVVMFCSCTMLSITLLVYFLLRTKQKFHMWVVASYIISLLLLNVLFGTSNILSQLGSITDATMRGSTACVLIGAATHLLILSTFIWLTFLNFNIWATFRLITSPSLAIQRYGIKRYLIFSSVAWGLPASVVVVGLSLDWSNSTKDPARRIFSPGYGIGRCLISRQSEGILLFYPIGIVIFINAAIFIYTILRISLYHELTNQLRTGNSRNKRQWRLIRIYTLLLLTAAVLWMTEFISWLMQWDDTVFYWIVIDALNLTQSILIFVIFVCRKKTLGSLEEKYPTVKKASIYFSGTRKSKLDTETLILKSNTK